MSAGQGAVLGAGQGAVWCDQGCWRCLFGDAGAGQGAVDMSHSVWGLCWCDL